MITKHSTSHYKYIKQSRLVWDKQKEIYLPNIKTQQFQKRDQIKRVLQQEEQRGVLKMV